MIDLEQQLEQMLADDARQLGGVSATSDEVISQGRGRRRRQQLFSGLAVVIIGATGFFAASQFAPAEQAEIDVVSDGSSDGATNPDGASDSEGSTVLSVPDDSDTTSDTDAESTTTTSGEGSADPGEDSDVIAGDVTASDGSTETIEQPETKEDNETPKQENDAAANQQGASKSMQSAAASMPDDTVLFASGAESCASTPDRHPDWVEGQQSNYRNDDGRPSHGFAYHSASASHKFVADERALEGDCVITLSVEDADRQETSARLFRRFDRQGEPLPHEAYYSAWIYVPEPVTHDSIATINGVKKFGFWTIFQLRNTVPGSESSIPTIDVGIEPYEGRPNSMMLSLYSKAACGSDPNCDGVTIQSNIPPQLPVAEWVHIELYVHGEQDKTGRVEIWQDGERVIDYQGQTERTGTSNLQWALTSSGVLHKPADHTLYVDDVIISTEPVTPVLKAMGAFD